MRSNKFIFFLVVLVIAGLTWVAFFGLNVPFGKNNLVIKGAGEMRYGIDIKGGVEAIYQPKGENRMPTEAELEQAKAIFETRLDAQQILDKEVIIDATNGNIMVRFPWKSDETEFNPQSAIAELGETALLTFKDPEGNIVLEGKHVTTAKAEAAAAQDLKNASSGGFRVNLELNDEGKQMFAEATGRLIGQQISIFMDEIMLSSPTVQSAITEGSAIITGMESMERARELASQINSGALPYALESKSYSTISPSLGARALDVMVDSAFYAFILVCLFMLLYYRLPGFVACFALVLQVIGQMLVLSAFQITLTLPGIAGLILSIGMGVDANVISSERIKEEINSGKTVMAAIESGFHKAFSAVFDGNITVIIVGIIMWIFGSGALLSFAYTLIIGVMLNFLAGVTASRLMIKSLSCFKFLRIPMLFGARRAK